MHLTVRLRCFISFLGNLSKLCIRNLVFKCIYFIQTHLLFPFRVV